MNVVLCQEMSFDGPIPRPESPLTVCVCVIECGQCNNNPLLVRRLGGKPAEEERKCKVTVTQGSSTK